MSETRIVDPATGGEKGQKLARFDLFPGYWEWELAEHYGKGCTKYADRNWERGYAWGLSYGALRRHLSLWIGGESHDQETGTHHLIAVIWHAIALYTFERRAIGTDDIRRRASTELEHEAVEHGHGYGVIRREQHRTGVR